MKSATVTPSGLRLSDAATFLGVSPGTVRNLARTGKLRSVLLNRARVFPVTALQALLDGQTPHPGV